MDHPGGCLALCFLGPIGLWVGGYYVLCLGAAIYDALAGVL